ncbi:MAG: hypothetical protein HY716_04015 [Planctomycetes bacterium]|nr:hypothetical protein [Planctomycetota bacterium]
MNAFLTCRACGERQTTAARLGDVQGVVFSHAEDCAFVVAIEAGRAREWVAKNGYPMCVEAGALNERTGIERGDNS